MENKLDQLFKNKLGKREEIPSPQAWSQINSQLKSGRKKVWMKRLAIAASILLFATIAVKLLDFRSFESNKSLSKSMTETEGIEKEILTSEQPDMIEEKPDLEMPKQYEPEAEQKEERPLIAKKEFSKREKLSNNIEIINPKFSTNQTASVLDEPDHTMENEGILEVAEAPLLTENREDESLHEEVVEKKKYNKVTIIYKASKNSTLVEPGKKNLIEKGIGEITKFSNDHLLTENRKAQLSQKKEDLMAMNFGKLFNNSIEDKKD